MNYMGFDVIHLAVALRLIIVLLLAYLTNMYWKNYRRLKSGFTTGLLFFSVFLLLQNLFAIYFRLMSGIDYGDEISLHNTVLNLLLLAGLSSLVFATRR